MIRRAFLFALFTLSFAWPCLAQRNICDVNGDCPNHDHQPTFSDPASRIPSGGVMPGPLFQLFHQEPYRNSDMGPLGVVLSTGEFQITVTDLEIPGRGFPFKLTRTYRSRRDGDRSLLGFNWHLNYDEYLTPGSWMDDGIEECEAVEWTMGNGFTELFVNECAAGGHGWKAFLGFFGRIRPHAGGGYEIRYADGTVKTFAQAAQIPGEIDVWLLTKIEDRNGNVMTIHHSGRGIDSITDTLGRTITFAYDDPSADWRITSVTDFSQPTPRRVDYHYDSQGNLDWVKAPEVRDTPNDNNFCEPVSSPACPEPRKTTTYRYLSTDGCIDSVMKHNLKSITDAKGQVFLTNSYIGLQNSPAQCGVPGGGAGLPMDAVVSQVYGGGTLSYGYANLGLGQGTAAGVIATQVTVTDRNDNVQVHKFNPQGNPLSIEYQMGGVRSGENNYVETNTYVDNGGGDQPMLVSRRTQSGGMNVNSSGNLVSYAEGMSEIIEYYDQQSTEPYPDPFQKGNVLRVRRIPRGAPIGEPEIVTQYEYEPLFNQPIKIIDPRGHITMLTYDYQEGTHAQLIASPTPLPVHDDWWPRDEVSLFMGVTGNSNLGDINGDLVAHNYQRHGNLLRREDGVATAYDGTPSTAISAYFVYNNFGLPTIQRDAEFNETHFEYFSEDNPDGLAPSTTQPTPDGRGLSSTLGPEGGGYLSKKILDATPDTALDSTPGTDLTGAAPPPLGNGRDSGQNPSPGDINLTFVYDSVGNIMQATDGRGVRTEYAINSLNQIVQITHAATDSNESPVATAFSYLEQFRYDANNNVIQHRSERRDDGSHTSPSPLHWVTKDMTYDVLDRKTSETISTDDVPAISLTTSYAYDGNGNLRKTVFPAGNAVLRIYDERDLLYQEVVLKNPSPDLAIMSFDPAVDSVTFYDYDGSGNVIQMTDPEGHKARTGYDIYDRKAVAFDPAFQKSTYRYDIGGNLLEQVSYGTIGGPTPEPSGPPVSDYPEISHQILYYDELSRLRRTDTRFFRADSGTGVNLNTDCNAGLGDGNVTCPAGSGAADSPAPAAGDGWVTSLVAYDRLGRVVRSVDDNGHAVETRYDGLGRKLKVLMNYGLPFIPEGANPMSYRNAIDYTYDANGNVKTLLETEYGGDRTVSPPRILGAQQHLSEFKYDSMNRQIEAKLVGRLQEEEPLLDYTTTTVYDSRGNKIQVTDPTGGRTKSFYDGLNRLTKTEAGYFWSGSEESTPLDNTANPDRKITTTYGYDVNSRLTSIKDDNNRITSFLYDNLNRQTRITYPDGMYRELAYNKDSLAISWTHFSNTGYLLVASTQYDWLHRAKQKDIYNSQAPWVIGTQRQSFEYDGLGRITLAQDDASTSDAFVDSEVALAYNSMGKVLSEGQTWRDNSSGQLLTKTNTVTSVYDGVGFRTSVVYPGPTAGSIDRTVTYHPDGLNRPERIVDSYTGTIQYDFMGMGRVLNRIYPNETKLTMLSGPTDPVGAGYDNARRIKDFASRTTAATPEVIAQFQYGYDKTGNRLFERRLHEPSGANSKGETYEYDAVYRLINRKEGEMNAANDIPSPATTQDFTLDGAGNWKTHKKNSSTYNQTINSLNQYTVFNGSLGQRTLNYDFLGNLTNESLALGDQQYTYDFLNRLVMYLSTGGDLTTYRYDALGRRISKNLNGWTHTRYVYDGDRLIQERDGTSAGNLVASYVYGMGSDEVLTRRRWQGGSHADIFYHTNALGSVAAVTNETGVVVERYKYDAYGQVTFLSPTFTPLTSSGVYNNILFTGRYFDIETKLYYYRARTYHPYLGRFLQRDPLGESASLNLYNYVFNNPVNATDPTGMWMDDSKMGVPYYSGGGGSRNIFCMAGLCGGGGFLPDIDVTYSSLEAAEQAAAANGSVSPAPTAGNLRDQRKLRSSTSATPLSSEGANSNQAWTKEPNACTMDPPGAVNVTIQTEILESGYDWGEPGVKSTQSLTVDAQSGLPLAPETRSLGTTYVPFVGPKEGVDYGIKSLTAVIDGSIMFSFSASVGSAVLPGLTIDYQFSIGYNPVTGTGWLSGAHDGYPSYRILLNGNQIYNYYQGWNTPATLFGTSDVGVNRPF